jgi:hypothetical protein
MCQRMQNQPARAREAEILPKPKVFETYYQRGQRALVKYIIGVEALRDITLMKQLNSQSNFSFLSSQKIETAC